MDVTEVLGKEMGGFSPVEVFSDYGDDVVGEAAELVCGVGGDAEGVSAHLVGDPEHG